MCSVAVMAELYADTTYTQIGDTKLSSLRYPPGMPSKLNVFLIVAQEILFDKIIKVAEKDHFRPTLSN